MAASTSTSTTPSSPPATTARSSSSPPTTSARRAPAPASRGRVEIADGVIFLHGGARIDLGGIGKGYACERAAEILATAGPCLVNAGGDIATRDGVWTVAVETPDGPLALELSGSCALATSGRDSRRWRRAGRELHHIIDPAHGRALGAATCCG